jgi:hypothetical protein
MAQKIKGMKNSDVTKTYNKGYVEAIMSGPFVVECHFVDADDSLFKGGAEKQKKLALECLVLSVDGQDLSTRCGATYEAHGGATYIERVGHGVQHLVRSGPVDRPCPHSYDESAVIGSTNGGTPRARMHVDFELHQRRRTSWGQSIEAMLTSTSEPSGHLAPPSIR